MATVAILMDNGFAQHFAGLDNTQIVLETLAQGDVGLGAIIATTAGELNLSSETISSVQQVLTDKQFYTGAIDGTFNPLFIRALDAYSVSASSQSGG